ncbi:unnamed protein product [Symbiodinium sp. CCMP2592]|nr:unnamed protein product [Symbiodinium sp. CCMP2592]
MARPDRPGVLGHLGPFPVEAGTLTSQDREEIRQETGCTVGVRGRSQWGSRCLTVCGPPSRLMAAKEMAEERIANSVEDARAPKPKGPAHGPPFGPLSKAANKGKGKGPAKGAFEGPPAPRTPPAPRPQPMAAPAPMPGQSNGELAMQLQIALSRISTLETSVLQLQTLQNYGGHQSALHESRLRKVEADLYWQERRPPRTRSRSPPAAASSSGQPAPARSRSQSAGSGSSSSQQESPASKDDAGASKIAQKEAAEASPGPDFQASAEEELVAPVRETASPTSEAEGEQEEVAVLDTLAASAGTLADTVSFSVLARREHDEGQLRTERRRITDEVLQFLDSPACPCGELLQHLQLTLVGGKKEEKYGFHWHFVQPMALLFLLTERVPSFGDMLQRIMDEKGRLRIGLYSDETKPGNPLRPDHGRAQVCFYFTCLDLPDWVRCQTGAWFHFSAFPCKLLSDVPGGLSHLFCKTMDVFFGEHFRWNFKTGFPLKCSKGTFLAQGSFECFVGDEKAIRETFSLRGATGTKPCCHCMNVLGHMDKHSVTVPGLVHYSCDDPGKFVLHSSQTFRTMCQKLEIAPKKDQKKLGQLFGLTMHPNAVLFCAPWKDSVDCVQHVYWDWMHILCASSGMGQYEVNEFLKILVDRGVSLDMLDEYAQQWRLPQRTSNLCKGFFAERLNKEPDSCLKCFAGELLTAILILDALRQDVLRHVPETAEHCRCLALLAKIFRILGSGDRAVQQLQELRRCIAEHARLFRRLYENCVKPKFHWAFHVPGCMEKFGVNMSCFVTERKNAVVKSLATIANGSHLQQNLNMRAAYSDVSHILQNPLFFSEVGLREPVRDLPWAVALLHSVLPGVQQVKAARFMKTAKGTIAAGDTIWKPGTAEVMVVDECLQAASLDGAQWLGFHGVICNQVGPDLFEASEERGIRAWSSEHEADEGRAVILRLPGRNATMENMTIRHCFALQRNAAVARHLLRNHEMAAPAPQSLRSGTTTVQMPGAGPGAAVGGA